MNILHIVPLASEDGAFGGPRTVALHQSVALQQRGHSCLVVSTTLGSAETGIRRDASFLLFPALRIPGLRFAGLSSRKMRRWLRVELGNFDLVHIHASRDLISLPAMLVAYRQNVPFIVQGHGMIVPPRLLSKRVFDLIVTKRLLARAAAVVALQDIERVQLRRLGIPNSKLRVVGNGVPTIDQIKPLNSNGSPTILFCSRLHPRKRVGTFLAMAALLRKEGSNAKFLIIGPDDGDAALVRSSQKSPDLAGSLSYLGGLPHRDTLAQIATADVFVLPSVDEPFPMVLLEAMSLGIPVITTTGCHISRELGAARAAMVVPPDARALADAVSAVLAPGERIAQGERGRQYVLEHATTSAMALLLERVYESVLEKDAVRARQRLPSKLP